MSQFSDMQGFLEDIHECCDEVSISWAADNLNPSALKVLKSKLNKFALEHRTDIMSFYSYAKTCGRYVMVNQPLLEQTMTKYEEYHDDLMEFIKSMLKEDTVYKSMTDAAKHVSEAAGVDEGFRNRIFQEPVNMVFPDSLENLDVFMELSAFIDKVYDNFIYLSRKKETAPERVKILIDLYSTSVLAFIKKMIDNLTSYISEMEEVISGNTVASKKEASSSYKLI